MIRKNHVRFWSGRGRGDPPPDRNHEGDLIVSDDHLGLVKAAEWYFQGATWQS